MSRSGFSKLIGLTVVVASALAIIGCGSSGERTTTSRSEAPPKAGLTPQVEGAVRKSAAAARTAEERAPKGSSDVLRQIYKQFTPPSPNPAFPGSAAAINAGRRACAGRSPVQVKERFIAAARSNLSPEERKRIAQIDRFEGNVARDPSFTAGQLAADVYEATLPSPIAIYGYQGCIYSLAVQLERRLAPH
jgi:hypothetical protein